MIEKLLELTKSRLDTSFSIASMYGIKVFELNKETEKYISSPENTIVSQIKDGRMNVDDVYEVNKLLGQLECCLFELRKHSLLVEILSYEYETLLVSCNKTLKESVDSDTYNLILKVREESKSIIYLENDLTIKFKDEEYGKMIDDTIRAKAEAFYKRVKDEEKENK